MERLKGMTLKDITALVVAIKGDIEDDFRAYDDDEEPGILLTVGYDPEETAWNFQTGDNSFTGGAYGFPHWGVCGVYRDSDCREVARDIISQIEETIYY